MAIGGESIDLELEDVAWVIPGIVGFKAPEEMERRIRRADFAGCCVSA